MIKLILLIVLNLLIEFKTQAKFWLRNGMMLLYNYLKWLNKIIYFISWKK